MDILWLDLETRSRCDLQRFGTYNYAADDSTEILIACWALNHGPVMQWRRWRSEPMPEQLAGLLADKRVQVRAHAIFERRMLKIDLNRYYDTAAQMRALAIPGGLDNAARFTGLKEKKNPRGQQLINLLSKPRKDGTFLNDPVLFEEFTAYCSQDVVVMRQLSLGFPQMDDATLALYRANEAINDRGIPIDGELCEWAVRYADEARDEAAARVKALTGGLLATARGTKLTDWVSANMPEEARLLMRVKKRRAVAVVSVPGAQDHAGATGADAVLEGDEYWTKTLDKGTRETLAEMAAANPHLYDDSVMEVVDACDAASPASVAKYEKLLDLAGSDGRVHDAFIMGGAGQTGRFAAWGAQVHNFPRACAERPEVVRKVMQRHGSLKKFGTTLAVLRSMLRAAIWPGAGRLIVRTDWNAVEARGLPWLADSPGARDYLDAFHDPTRQPYLEQADKSGVPGNRPVGKLATLSLGYQGGAAALQRIAKGQGVVLPIPAGTIVLNWRTANQWAVAFWAALERGARQAIISPGSKRAVGRVTFEYVKCVNWEALTMTLPSGRKLYYPYAKLTPRDDEREGSEITYCKSAWKPKATGKDGVLKPWPRAKLWGGLAAENATQGACADLLREVVRYANGGTIAHVHDEMVSEASAKSAARVAKEQEKRMLALPAWAKGFPLAVETDISERFRK